MYLFKNLVCDKIISSEFTPNQTGMSATQVALLGLSFVHIGIPMPCQIYGGEIYKDLSKVYISEKTTSRILQFSNTFSRSLLYFGVQKERPDLILFCMSDHTSELIKITLY